MENITANYCLPIIEPELSKVLTVIDQNRGHYSHFEVWLDYIEDLSPESLLELERTLGPKLIVLFRRKDLAPTRMPMSTRFKLIESLRGQALLDLDITSQKREIELVKGLSNRPPLIISYHNYNCTPDHGELTALIASMREHNPAILKVATLAQNQRDALRLLTLLLELKESGQRCIVLGMGEHGVITRIFGTLWGNELIFAPECRSKSSAPGQLTRGELESIFNVMHPTAGESDGR